jgi:hypothetical protein
MRLSETTAIDEHAYGLTTALENHATHLRRTRRHGLWNLILERRHSLLAYREDCRDNPVIRKSHRKSAIPMTGTLLCGCINSERSNRRKQSNVRQRIEIVVRQSGKLKFLLHGEPRSGHTKQKSSTRSQSLSRQINMIRVYLHRLASSRISARYEVLAYGYRNSLALLEV